MKHEVGDKVKIKSKEWYENNEEKDADGDILCGGIYFDHDMRHYCGKSATITGVADTYSIDIDNGDFWWTDEMFEDDEPQVSEMLLQDIANVIKLHNMGVQVSEQDGKLIIEPLKIEEKDLPVDTPVMVSDDDINFTLRYYAGNGEVFNAGQHDAEIEGTCRYLTTIPWDRFNPKDISESLKHNIVKE